MRDFLPYKPWCSRLKTFEFKISWFIFACKKWKKQNQIISQDWLNPLVASIYFIIKESKLLRTCNSCISFSCNFVLKISFVIFSCSSSKCSGLNPLGLSSRLIGIDVVVLLLLLLTLPFSLPLFDSLRWSAGNLSSSNFGYFGGTDTNPRCKRFRSFSRMSMNVWENLQNAKYRKISAISRRRIDRIEIHQITDANLSPPKRISVHMIFPAQLKR